jgi:hypothetical protein
MINAPPIQVPMLANARELSTSWTSWFTQLQREFSLLGSLSVVNQDAVPYLTFSPTAPSPLADRSIAWNADDQTLQIQMAYGVVQPVGMNVYARVENATGVTIPKGAVVGFSGVGPGNVLSVSPYLADGSTPSLYILGVMAHDLPNAGQVGYCCVWGHVGGINTAAFSVGDIMYASPTVAGAFTATKPTAPNNVIPVAAVLADDSVNGEVFVRPTIEQQKYYGEFTKTSDQSPAVINTAYALTFDNTEIANGISIGSPPSRIAVVQSGLYQFDATVQIGSSSSSPKTVWLWFRKNGTDIANTARLVTININNGYTAVSMSEFFSLAANDRIEIMFAADATAITVDNVAATAFAPAAPAVVLAVSQIQQ